ncbi:hypothetical protein [Methylophilus sp.]|jgi:hypothetical protein|uniref:hypothetical protein n=1 Tax=Methylophilus sp. TaxID=29541 RepID=UPI00257DE409|nr:hypothetical protein [Methylophilus sp.]
MLIKQIKIWLAVGALMLSFNTEAKIEYFQDSFTGSLARDVQNDFFWFTGQSTFVGDNVSLTTTHEIVEFEPDSFYAFGIFSRNDGLKTFSGNFELYYKVDDPYNPPNPWLDPLTPFPVGGYFRSEQSLYSPVDGTVLEQTILYGEINGVITNREYLSFTVNWALYTFDAASAVPAPSPIWLFASGLLLLSSISYRKKYRLFSR